MIYQYRESAAFAALYIEKTAVSGPIPISVWFSHLFFQSHFGLFFEAYYQPDKAVNMFLLMLLYKEQIFIRDVI